MHCNDRVGLDHAQLNDDQYVRQTTLPSALSIKRPRADTEAEELGREHAEGTEKLANIQEGPGALKKEDGQVQQPERLSYWIPPDCEPGKYWTHELYRSPTGEPVTVHYCRNRTDSERIAKQFLKCPTVGFDMEWAPFGAKGIKGNISVIQVASEDTIALFHIALHDGRTVAELLAPSLRKLIESESILKCGVAINNADGSRLRTWMQLKPRGLLELSHMHRVAKWAKRDRTKVTKKLIKMTHLAEEHLGRPLFKGDVRTSNWTKALTEEQICYAAADAYAGFRLFHAIEAKRLKLSAPIPPRPAPAELGLPLLLGYDDIEAEEEQIANAAVELGDQAQAASDVPAFKIPSIDYLALGDPSTRRAFSALRALRKRMSIILKQRETNIVADTTLFSLAENRPSDKQALEKNVNWQRFADLTLTHGNIGLLAFLRRHSRDDGDQASDKSAKKGKPHAKKGKAPAKPRSQSSSDGEYFESMDVDTVETAVRSTRPKLEPGYELHFSDDEFEESDLDDDDLAAVQLIDDGMNQQIRPKSDDNVPQEKFFSEDDFDDTDLDVDDVDEQLDKLHTSFSG